MQKSKNLVEAGFLIFFFHFWNFGPPNFKKLTFFKFGHFLSRKMPKSWKKIKNSKIRPLQVFLIFIYCNYAKNQEVLLIIEVCIKFQRPFFSPKIVNFWHLRGQKMKNLHIFHKKCIWKLIFGQFVVENEWKRYK